MKNIRDDKLCRPSEPYCKNASAGVPAGGPCFFAKAGVWRTWARNGGGKPSVLTKMDAALDVRQSKEVLVSILTSKAHIQRYRRRTSFLQTLAQHCRWRAPSAKRQTRPEMLPGPALSMFVHPQAVIRPLSMSVSCDDPWPARCVQQFEPVPAIVSRVVLRSKASRFEQHLPASPELKI